MIIQAQYLKNISAERIRVELTKLLVSDHPDKLLEAYVTGITSYILPEFDKMMEQPQNNPYHRYNVGVHSIEAVKNIRPDVTMRWAALLHDVGKPATHTVDENGIDHFFDHPEGCAYSGKAFCEDSSLTTTLSKMCVLWSDGMIMEWEVFRKKGQYKKAFGRSRKRFLPIYNRDKKSRHGSPE